MKKIAVTVILCFVLGFVSTSCEKSKKEGDVEKQEVTTNDPTAGKDYKISYADFLALNFNSSPDRCKVIVLSLPVVDIANAELIDNTDNS